MAGWMEWCVRGLLNEEFEARMTGLRECVESFSWYNED